MDKNKKTIIFDFDGTLADTFEIMLDALDQYSGDFGVELADKKILEDLRNMSATEILKHFKIPFFLVPFITAKIQKNLGQKIDEIQPFNDVIKEIKKVRDEYNIGILTSNSKSNVEKFVEKERIKGLFDFIWSESNIFGKDKAIHKVLNKYDIEIKDMVYVGDEARDVEACQKIGVNVVSVGWGFNSSKLLKRINAKNFVGNPEDLTKKIKSIFNS